MGGPTVPFVMFNVASVDTGMGSECDIAPSVVAFPSMYFPIVLAGDERKADARAVASVKFSPRWPNWLIIVAVRLVA
jgi:hypothetical protein